MPYNRQAMDQLTREIRQSKKVLAYTTNSITILTANDDGADGPTVTYSFSPSTKKMLRTSSDGTSKALLNNCSLLSFQLFTRCPSNAVFGSFPVAVNNWSQYGQSPPVDLENLDDPAQRHRQQRECPDRPHRHPQTTR